MHNDHVYLVGNRRRDRAAALESLELPDLLVPPISAHRVLRGPYTAAGTLVRAIVPDAVVGQPELVAAHQVAILTVAPELAPELAPRVRLIDAPDAARVEERWHCHPRPRTGRTAHGLVEFVADVVRAAGVPRALVVDDLDHADPTDREFVAILLRRTDPTLLTVVVCGTAALVDQPARPGAEELAVTRLCRRIDAAALPEPPVDVAPAALAARYVAGDCTSDDDAELAAYASLPKPQRQALHDARAAELAASVVPPVLGAIPYHLERGRDRLGRGANAMLAAVAECLRLGCFDAVIDLCRRGRAATTWADQPRLRWLFTRELPTAFRVLGRVSEAAAICHEATANSTLPVLHLRCAHATAMLHLAFPGDERLESALVRMNQAVAIAGLLPDTADRCVELAFQYCGLALVEARRDRPDRALRLLQDGLDQLDYVFRPDQHVPYRSVLLCTRARVLADSGRAADAVADYRAVIDIDPDHPDHHFELAVLLGGLDRADEALAEYAIAQRLGPPYPLLFFRRAELLLRLGNAPSALADLDRVLELDPGFVDAYVHRAGIQLRAGRRDAAMLDALTGLAYRPDDPELLTVLARVHTERGDNDAARSVLNTVLDRVPDLVPALAARATVAYLGGDVEAAIVDLTRAVQLAPECPTYRYHRALAFQETGEQTAAQADLAMAAALHRDGGPSYVDPLWTRAGITCPDRRSRPAPE